MLGQPPAGKRGQHATDGRRQRSDEAEHWEDGRMAETQNQRPGDEAPAGTPGTGEDVCPKCHGTGKIQGKDCPECSGTGVITRGIGGA